MLFKTISVKSPNGAQKCVDSAFLNDIEVRVVLRGAESSKNNLCEAPENSPASWCKKSESKGAEVPPADFLLEAEKRGSPPKSEKRQLLARRGSEVGGAALLREETSEVGGNSVRVAESEKISGLPRSHLFACNDEIFAESSEITSEIIITFFALENDLEALVRGYLSVFDLKADLVRENNIFYADLPLSKEAILAHLSQKDFIQSCEQISLSDKKIMRNSVIMPFNGSRAKITNAFLEANRAFLTQNMLDSAKCVDSADLDYVIYNTKIFFLESITNSSIVDEFSQLCEVSDADRTDSSSRKRGECNCEKSPQDEFASFDTNPKNAIYKTIGKAFQKSNHLLDSAIFLNFCIDIECLKILLLQKCTFIVCKNLPPFSVVKFAQKFGATLVCFHRNEFFAITHQMRLN